MVAATDPIIRALLTDSNFFLGLFVSKLNSKSGKMEEKALAIFKRRQKN